MLRGLAVPEVVHGSCGHTPPRNLAQHHNSEGPRRAWAQDADRRQDALHTTLTCGHTHRDTCGRQRRDVPTRVCTPTPTGTCGRQRTNSLTRVCGTPTLSRQHAPHTRVCTPTETRPAACTTHACTCAHTQAHVRERVHMNMLADTRKHAHTKQTCTYIHCRPVHTLVHTGKRVRRALTTQAGTDPELSWGQCPGDALSRSGGHQFWGGSHARAHTGGLCSALASQGLVAPLGSGTPVRPCQVGAV